MTDFQKEIDSMKRMAEYLMGYCHNAQDKADVAVLATRELCVHGYQISFYLSKEKQTDFYLWNLQMYTNYQGFLPFSLVCECASRFLGNRDLGFTEMIVLGRKLYTWSLAVDKDSTPIPIPPRPNVESRNYDGLTYYTTKVSHLIVTS
jgi:hypothetical protein